MSGLNYVTKETFEQMKADLQRMKAVDRPAASKAIAEAKEKAKTAYDRIIADAQSAIDQQKNAAIVDVKNMIGKMVIEVTEKVIRKELVNQKDHEDYIRKLAEDLTNTGGAVRN